MNNTQYSTDYIEAPHVRHQHGHRRLIDWNLESYSTCRHQTYYMPTQRWNPHMSEDDADKEGVNAVESVYCFKSQSKWAFERDCSMRRKRERSRDRTNKWLERESQLEQVWVVA